MKKIYKSILPVVAGTVLCFSFSSCEDYLDKAPETTVSSDDAFKNFRNFQGFVEEIYECIPDKEKCNWCPSWNWGDDEIFNPEADDRMTHQVDLGNFRAWNQTGNWLYKSNPNDATESFRHSLWGHAWYCIRKCNQGIERIDEMVGTNEEKNLLLGQMYFFRAWWHFELMEYFGGLPYIDKCFGADEELNLPRLSYTETAEKVAADFSKAAELLPIDWDNTVVGAQTSGKNQLRVNKITALGYLGKNYLWAGSPLMKNGAQVGGANTYNYDEEYCRKAAETFGELLNLVETGQTQYALVEFKYEDVYNHSKASGTKTSFSDLFYTMNQSWLQPGSTEAIMRGPSLGYNNSNWNTSKVFGPKAKGLVEHDNVIHQPTANLVEAYGMENGLPIDDPESGFDPTHPWKNRDPRFYHDIVFDGFKFVNGTLEKEKEDLRYCSLYTGGRMREVADASQTGYFIQKLVPHICNIADKGYDDKFSYSCYLSYMRLADIYLMYAEAGAAIEGANYKSSNFNKTALEAINTIRQRCGAGNVADKYATDKNKFMDEIRREREVELSFEGFRFNDLQRWLLLTEYPYNTKYANDFDRKENDEYFTSDKNDPRNAEVANYRRTTILTRNFNAKHYWFPFPESEIYIYKDFTQNPGW